MRTFAGIWLGCAICVALSVGAGAQEVRQAPFEIPPNGKPEVLVGGIEFEAPSALAFDSRNRPYMFHTRESESFGYILTLREKKWVRLSYIEVLRKKYPQLQSPKREKHALGSIAIDNDDALYVVLSVRKNNKETAWVLLYSADLGGHFTVHELPHSRLSFLEISTGHNNKSQPPAIGCLVWRKDHPAKFAEYYDLLVFLPVKKKNQLTLGDPVKVSTDCSGIAIHSGGYSFAATTGSKTHVVYLDVPKDKKGNPTYVATIDRATRRVTARKFLVDAPPNTPDAHSSPVIAVDSRRRLHVLAGAHGQSFYYMRSTMPDRIDAGWTKPSPQGSGQTYATLICDSGNRLHSVYRTHPKLFYQHKAATADKWSVRTKLVHAPKGHQGYTIFYHRLFVDRADALYLSFTFFEFHTGAKGRYPRALAVFEDNGQSWRLATTETFLRRVVAEKKGEQGTPADADKPRR